MVSSELSLLFFFLTRWLKIVLFSHAIARNVLTFAYFCQAAEMLSNTRGSIPMIFLVTDGAVEDERNICDWMKKRLTNGGSLFPRIHTFGIGNFRCLSLLLIAFKSTEFISHHW